MRVLISGASGLVGSALSEFLRAKGYEVRSLVRRKPAISTEFFWDPEIGELDPLALVGVNAVVHLAGENIADRRWNESHKQRVVKSRISGTSLLAERLAALALKPQLFLSASAIGYYGDRGAEELDETSLVGTGFLAETTQRWEAATLAAEHAGIRTVRIRIGLVLSKKGGALKKMLLPFKLGVGGVLGSGNQYMSWIALNDLVRIIDFAISNQSIKGSINAVSPEPITNREFTKALAGELHRPAIFPVPAFMLRLIFGEMADALLLSSARVMPRALQNAGFTFNSPTLSQALK